ncbi:MAG: glycosyltransferase family 39 protein [Pirellulales bacterium]
MLESLTSTVAVASIAAAAFGLGRPLLRGLAVGDDDALATGVWSVALGLVCGATLLAVLGLAGLLYRPVIAVLTLVAGAWGLVELVRALERQRDSHSIERKRATRALERQRGSRPFEPPRDDGPLPQGAWLPYVQLGVAGLAAAGALVAALAPPTAGDALCYHLELPRTFLREHALVYLPDSDNCTFPLLIEMCYLWALALDGGVAAQLVHWAFGILLALATTVMARPILGKAWARSAGCLVLLVPGVTNQMTAPLNDVGLAAFTTLALAAWWRAAVDDEDSRWYLVAGLVLGGALGAKYLALVFALAMAAAGLWLWWRHPGRRRQMLVGTAGMAVIAVSVSGLWYVRSAWHRGNPVYPFFHEQLGGQTPPDPGDGKLALGRNPLALPAAPWQLTLFPERFGGRGHQLGALFLATLPALVVCRRLRGLGLLLGISLVYFGCWFLLRQNVRFLLPLVPLALVGVAWFWMEWHRLPRLPALFIGGLTSLLLAVGLFAGVHRARGKLAVALGRESRESYLLRSEPTYRAALYANLVLGEGAHILSQEHRSFYFQPRVTRESIYRRRTAYDQSLESASLLSGRLREAGFTHLLLAEAENDAGVRYNATLSRLAEADEEGIRCLTEYRFCDTDGAIRRYRLMSLR